MESEAPPRARSRRNRIIAIAAGVITVIAIVPGFAGDFLGMPWHWMRPAAELLLLAELVGLVVLERHQLFEPVHERVEDIYATLEELTQQIGALGQTTVYRNSRELIEGMTRTTRLALERDHEAPQTLRVARLLGHFLAVENDPEFAAQIQDWGKALADYGLSPGSRADARVRWWSTRSVYALNSEIKFIARAKVEAVLSPALITDREVISAFDDVGAALRWGILFQGRQYVTLFSRWSDEL